PGKTCCESTQMAPLTKLGRRILTTECTPLRLEEPTSSSAALLEELAAGIEMASRSLTRWTAIRPTLCGTRMPNPRPALLLEPSRSGAMMCMWEASSLQLEDCRAPI